MTVRSARGTRRQLGLAVAVAVALGCQGTESLSGSGGSTGRTSGTGGAAATGGSAATGGGSAATGGARAAGGSGGDIAGSGGDTGGSGAVGGSGKGGGRAGTGGSGGAVGRFNTNVDILFMIDDSSEMTEMQAKLYVQLPQFIRTLQALPAPPSLHVAVVSSDMGAPGDSTTSIACTQFGDQGQFQSAPRSDTALSPPVTCTNTTLATPPNASDSNHTFISDADMIPNYTDASLSDVLQCIALLGDTGCGFEHQLASIDRALGADGIGPAPGTNTGFLRPDAYLVIILLTNEDDCSAPTNTQLYSLKVGGSNQQNLANALGPIANYRCNQYGHLCQDPASANPTALIEPPLTPPADAQGTATAPTLNLTNCQSNDTNGLLTPVGRFVSDIKSLKPDPDNQIMVAAISGPAAPYTVAWAPESGGQNPQPGELWPQMMHVCGPKGGSDVNPTATQLPTDGSWADPGVRIAQFVNAFPQSVLGSICDASYAATMSAVATKIGQLIGQP